MKILILVDYKGYFGSKQFSELYRGGMNIPLLIQLFNDHGFEVEVLKFSDLQLQSKRILEEKPIILYQSQEDKNSFYKSYIEDIIYDLEQRGMRVVPSFACLKAHNNKVAMELLRTRINFPSIETIKTMVFGTLEEVLAVKSEIDFPIVIKPAWGAMSKGVALVKNEKELARHVNKISKSHSFKHDLKEVLRKVKYRRNYIKESFNRNKFVIQNLIPNLCNDWKVLVYGNYAFALYRHVRDNDFRASGSGKFFFKKVLPQGMLDYALSVRKAFNVPYISLDIAHDGEKFHLIEFQFINFGTTTLEKSDFFFERKENKWLLHESKVLLEEVFVKSTVEYINKNYHN